MQASRAASPLRSAPALAAVGEVLATRPVLAVSTRTRASSRPRVRAATTRILRLTPWPISTAPVLTPTLPSW